MRLIDADAFIAKLNHVPMVQEAIRKAMDTMPTIEERKKGKWVTYVISMVDGEGCRCSECGFEGVPYWDFCPNCGADMRGEQG